MKTETKKYLISLSLIMILTGIVLWITLRNDQENVLRVLSQISLSNILSIIGLCLLYNLFSGWSIYVMIRPLYPKYRFRDAMLNELIGAFFSGITPSASGGQIGQIYVFSKQKVSGHDGAGILWLDFVIYQMTLIVMTLVLLVLKFTAYYHHFPILFLFVLIGFVANGSIMLVLLSMAKFPKLYLKVCHFGVKVFVKLHLAKNPEEMYKNIGYQLEQFTINIQDHSVNVPLILKVSLANFLRLFVYFSIPWAIGKILHVDIPFVDSMALSSFVAMANFFFPIPGASGGTEMMFHQLFTLLIGSTYVSSVMILWRFATYHLVLLIGGTLFVYLKIVKGR